VAGLRGHGRVTLNFHPDRLLADGRSVAAAPDGACPRFGSCHLRLRADVLERSTFCFGDSHLGAKHLGTIDAFEAVLAAPGARIDAALVGVAAASVVTDPQRWRGWGTPDETLQHLKKLWHVLVAYGAPADG